MRVTILWALLLTPLVSAADEYTCSYLGYATRQPIIVKIRIDGSRAQIVDGELVEPYLVLENTDAGVVLARAFAYNNANTHDDEVGLFGFVINKRTLAMTRGNIIQGDDRGAVRHGRCAK